MRIFSHRRAGSLNGSKAVFKINTKQILTDFMRLPVVSAGAEFLVIVFLNIGKFLDKTTDALGKGNLSSTLCRMTLSVNTMMFSSTWQKVKLRTIQQEIEPFNNEAGFELTAKRLGISRPQKVREQKVQQ